MRVPVQVILDTETGELTFQVPANDGAGDVVLYARPATVASADVERLPVDPEGN